MTQSQVTYFIGGALVSLLALVILPHLFSHPTFGSAPSGVSATLATSSIESLAAGTNSINLIATSTCAARIITVGQNTLFTFNGNPATLGSGVWQAASTSAVYDGSLYGCGAVDGISAVAETITVMETR